MAKRAKLVAAALGVSAAVLGMGLAAAGEPQRASPNVSLAGRWAFNKQLSDDAREKMREAREKQGPGGAGGMGRPGGGSGGPGAGGGMGGRGGMGGPPPGAGGGDEPREAMRAILEPPEELLIAQTEAEIAVDETFGRMRRLHPDGKKYKTDNGASEIKSYWKEGRLVVETRGTRGTSIETWERVPDGSRLIVMVRLEGGPGGRLELKRLYDLVPPAAEGAGR